jgi:multicomponent Na+:H+ antiporter subunit E
MNLLIINMFLAILWSALTGVFTLENLTTGFILGYLTLFVLRGAFGKTYYFLRVSQIVRFSLFFLWELLIANLRVARDVLRPGPLRMKPRVIAVPLEHCGDIGVTLLANVLSLTPGTLSLDVAADRCVLFVHAIHAPDAEKAILEIKQGFERLVLNILTPGAEGSIGRPFEPEQREDVKG